MFGKTIITYLTDGTPFGIKTVQFSNRLILGISIPRKDFDKAKKQKELERSGIYFLFGEDESGSPLAYIGQATVLLKRLSDHYKDTKKDFWNVAVAFTTKDGTFNESDINYLERELIQEAERAERYITKNGNSGNSGLIQEYRVPDMIEYINDLKVLLSSLGFPVLQDLSEENNDSQGSGEIFLLKNRGSDAKGMYTQEGFVVLKGSKLSTWEVTPSHVMDIVRKRKELEDAGFLKNEEFIKDCVFKTPTAACNAIAGGNQNGWLEWKTKDGRTLDEIERKQLN